MMILMIGLMSGGIVRWVFFPDIPSDFIQANVEMQPGTSEERTIEVLESVSKGLAQVDERAEANEGGKVVRHTNIWMNGTEAGTVFAELKKGEDRNIDGYEIVNQWRESVPELAGVRTINSKVVLAAVAVSTSSSS